MFYQVIAYNSKTDTLVEHRLSESKSEALRFVRESEKAGFDSIRLFIDENLPRQFNFKVIH